MWRKLARRHSTVAAPAALVLVVVAGEHRVGVLPGALARARRPQRLRLGAVDDDRAEALQLAAVAAVDQRVVSEAWRLDELQPRLAGARRGGAGNVIAAAVMLVGHTNGLGASRRACKALFTL
jgi:hypothetical protein